MRTEPNRKVNLLRPWKALSTTTCKRKLLELKLRGLESKSPSWVTLQINTPKKGVPLSGDSDPKDGDVLGSLR